MKPGMPEEHVYRITLVRHGESVGNAEERLQGHIDYPLSDRGRAQVLALAQRWNSEGITFDHVIASPLSRALESARLIAAELKIAGPEIDRRWIEQDAGRNAGLRWDEVEQRADVLDAALRGDFPDPRSESDADLHRRGQEALDALLERPPARYLVVSHRALLNAVLLAILGVAPQTEGPRRANFRIANGSFSRVRFFPMSHQWQVDVIGARADRMIE